MQKNLYYRTVTQRRNFFKDLFFSIFLSISGFPRMFLEVFIRKNFGERYFNFGIAIFGSILLFFYPFVVNFIGLFYRYKMSSYGGYGPNPSINWWDFFLQYGSLYLFIFLFLKTAWKREKELRSNPSVFDFAKFSLYSGDINPAYYEVPWREKKLTIRTAECFMEPLPFFGVGLILFFFGQTLGTFFMICSVIYCISYMAAYYNGAHFVMDKIDEMIMNEELENAFVDDLDPSQTRGVRFYGEKPTDADLRRKLSESFVEGEEDDDRKGVNPNSVLVT
jgi:hypothetical protein